MLEGKITPALCINVEDYEAKLEKLANLMEKMSHINWTTDSAIQFCKEQGMQIEDFMLPQFYNLNTELNELNNLNYDAIKNKIIDSKKQILDLRFAKFDDYNESYQNYINNILSNKNTRLNAFWNISVETKRVDTYFINIKT